MTTHQLAVLCDHYALKPAVETNVSVHHTSWPLVLAAAVRDVLSANRLTCFLLILYCLGPKPESRTVQYHGTVLAACQPVLSMLR